MAIDPRVNISAPTGAVASAGASSFAPTIGLGLQAFSSIAGILAKRDTSRLNAFIAGKNAEIKEAEAKLSRKIGDIAEAETRKEGRRFTGKQRAAIGVTGLTSGSFAELTEQTAMENELDAMTVRFRSMVAEGDIKAAAGREKITEVIERGKKRKAGFEGLLSTLGSTVKITSELKKQGIIK